MVSCKKVIAVFARAPVPGEVKTRLARHIGNETAVQLYGAMLRDTLELARPTAEGDAETVLIYTPENAFQNGPHSLASLWNGPRLPQTPGDLGRRMLDCTARLRARGVERIVIIGSDSPDLERNYIRLAFARLEEHPLVFGPTHDGGFYLLGASVPLPSSLFDDVEWSTSLSLGRCLEAARRQGIRSSFIPPWDDVDTLTDVNALRERLESNVSQAPSTLAWLRSHNL
jgi:uncharacterized protein